MVHDRLNLAKEIFKILLIHNRLHFFTRSFRFVYSNLNDFFKILYTRSFRFGYDANKEEEKKKDDRNKLIQTNQILYTRSLRFGYDVNKKEEKKKDDGNKLI